MQGISNNFLHSGNQITFISQSAALPDVWLNYGGCTGGITNYHLGSGKGDGTYGNLVANNIVANGGVSAAGVSDARLKHDINPLDDALSLINMVKVKTFRYNSIARELDNNLPVRDAGFIAQEFVKVFPEHVKEMYDGKYLGIRYDKMIPYLTRGIQEVDNNTRKIKQVTVEILDIIGSTGIGEPVKMRIHELLNTLNTIR